MLVDFNAHQHITQLFTDLGMLDRAYYVGGMVRDHFLHVPNNDIDIVIEKVTSDDIEKLDNTFGDWVGKDFPVYKYNLRVDNKVFELDIAVARKETSNGDGTRDFTVDFGEDVDINIDLARRDVTINAMAIPINDLDSLIDNYNGKKDLVTRVLRHTTSAFAEDPLRVFRVARFSAKYFMAIDSNTLKLMSDLRDSTRTLFKERIHIELVKMFISADYPSVFFRVLRDCNNLDIWFPLLHKMIGIPHIHTCKLHDVDVFDHTMKVIDNLSKSFCNVDTMIGGLFHDVGKVLTDANKLPKHYGHDTKGLLLVDEICDRLRLPNVTVAHVNSCIKYHLKINRVLEMRPANIIKMVDFLNKNKTLDSVINLAIADRKSKGFPDFSCKEMEVIRTAQYVCGLNIPQELQDKINTGNFKNSSEKVTRLRNIILQWRVEQFKGLMS